MCVYMHLFEIIKELQGSWNLNVHYGIGGKGSLVGESLGNLANHLWFAKPSNILIFLLPAG